MIELEQDLQTKFPNKSPKLDYQMKFPNKISKLNFQKKFQMKFPNKIVWHFQRRAKTVIHLLIRVVMAYTLRFWAVTSLILYALVWVITARWSPLIGYFVFHPDFLGVGWQCPLRTGDKYVNKQSSFEFYLRPVQ